MSHGVGTGGRVLIFPLVCYLALLWSMTSRVSGQSASRQSERQAPAGLAEEQVQLIQFESILPDVVFGERDGIRFETEIVVTNPDSRPALLELTFYQPSGEPVHELFQVPAQGAANQSTWAHTQGFCPATLVEVFAGNEHFYRELPAHSVTEILLPGPSPALVGKEFAGWALVRSNSPLAVYERIKLSDARGFSSHIEVLANSGGTRAEMDLIYELGYSSAGQRYQNGQIVFVNPGDQAASLKLTLQQVNWPVTAYDTVEIPAHKQQTVILDKLFGLWNKNATYRLAVGSSNRVPIAVIGMGIRTLRDLSDQPAPRVDEAWMTIQAAQSLKLPGDAPYSLPEELIQDTRLADWSLSLNRFGLVATQGASRIVHPLNIGCGYAWSGVTTDSGTGLAAVYAVNETGIFFGKTGKLVTLGYGLRGRTPVFRALADPNLVEVEMGSGCSHFILTIDLSQEEIVSTRRGSDNCWY